MKKKLRLLFIIPLLVIPFIKVGADETNTGYRYITLKVNTGIPINANLNNENIHHGNFYLIELDNNIALCLNANRQITKGAKYKFLTEIKKGNFRNDFLIKAYMYAVNNKNLAHDEAYWALNKR